MAGVVTPRGIGVLVRIRVAYRDDVLFDGVAADVVQMPVLQVIGVAGVLHGGMAAAWPVLMIVSG